MDTITQTAGPRERARLDEQAREAAAGRNITVTDADLNHLRHVDNCQACQSGEESDAYFQAERERIEAARVTYVGGIHVIRDRIAKAARGECEPLTVDQIDQALAKLTGRADRAWRKA